MSGILTSRLSQQQFSKVPHFVSKNSQKYIKLEQFSELSSYASNSQKYHTYLEYHHWMCNICPCNSLEAWKHSGCQSPQTESDSSCQIWNTRNRGAWNACMPHLQYPITIIHNYQIYNFIPWNKIMLYNFIPWDKIMLSTYLPTYITFIPIYWSIRQPLCPSTYLHTYQPIYLYVEQYENLLFIVLHASASFSTQSSLLLLHIPGSKIMNYETQTSRLTEITP